MQQANQSNKQLKIESEVSWIKVQGTRVVRQSTLHGKMQGKALIKEKMKESAAKQNQETKWEASRRQGTGHLLELLSPKMASTSN